MTKSFLRLSFCSTKVFFFASGSVFEEYVFLVLEVSGSSPLIPSERVVEFNDIDNKLVRESVLKDIECGFFVEGISCFVCKALELSNVVIKVFLLHLEFSELPLGSGFDGSVSGCIGELIKDCIPQIFFGRKYSYYLVYQPFCLFCDPIVGVWSSDEG